MADESKKDKNEILKKVTASTLTLRVAIGGFLVYLAYSIGIGLGDTSGKDTIILGGFTILFALIGAAIVLFNGYRLLRKDYYDPIRDTEIEETTEQSKISDSEEQSPSDAPKAEAEDDTQL